jgi:nucleotide-binding universal stress UspA family protein
MKEFAAFNVAEDALIATNSIIEDLGTITTGDSILQKVKEDAQKWFNFIKQKSSANGIRLRTGLVISPIEIEDAIVNYADRENVDLIVIGGGKSGLKQRLLGSPTSHVATQTKRPILIVRKSRGTITNEEIRKISFSLLCHLEMKSRN